MIQQASSSRIAATGPASQGFKRPADCMSWRLAARHMEIARTSIFRATA
jgi:hypothetical protein